MYPAGCVSGLQEIFDRAKTQCSGTKIIRAKSSINLNDNDTIGPITAQLGQGWGCLLTGQVYYVNMEHRKIILFTSSPSYT